MNVKQGLRTLFLGSVLAAGMTGCDHDCKGKIEFEGKLYKAEDSVFGCQNGPEIRKETRKTSSPAR